MATVSDPESELTLEAAEARCVELHALWMQHESAAAFHRRHDHLDADRFQRTADAWKADYDAAVRDLARLMAAASRP